MVTSERGVSVRSTCLGGTRGGRMLLHRPPQ
jgi:hypothetical protein